MTRTKIDTPPQENTAAQVALEHLTGPLQGTYSWLAWTNLDVNLDADRLVHIVPSKRGQSQKRLIALFLPINGNFKIEAINGIPIWVNGERIKSRQLKHCDMIEFGESGPMSRYLVFDEKHSIRQNTAEILGDIIAYVRTSRRPIGKRLLRGASQLTSRFARETTILFRLGVVIALVALAVFVYQQRAMNALLQQQIDTGAIQLESIARSIVQARKEALTPGDLELFRQEFAGRISTTTERVTELERRSTAIGRAILEATSSVVFLQGAYGFQDVATGRMLRFIIDSEGNPISLPNGLPMLSLDGKGQIAERQFFGTAFAVGGEGILVTNRHVAKPWEHGAGIITFNGGGLEPKMIRFIGYLSSQAEPSDVMVVKASDEADLALLKFIDMDKTVSGLKLAEVPPNVGEEVILLGYPTGLRSILAQAGDAMIREIQESEQYGFWEVASRLAKAERIVPLASGGIIGRVSEEMIVFDAETAPGGSGGPVLNADGAVVAITAAVLAEFGGSNLGVPVSKLRKLLSDADLGS